MTAMLGFFASSRPIIGQYCSSYNATEVLSPSISWRITNLQPVNRNRWLYVVWTFVSNNERYVTDVTIAGNSAASVKERVALRDGGDFLYNVLYKARVATGTSATATLNVAGLRNRAGGRWSSSAWSLTAPTNSGFTEVTDHNASVEVSTNTVYIPNSPDAFAIGSCLANNAGGTSPPTSITFAEMTRHNHFAETNHRHATISGVGNGQYATTVLGSFSRIEVIGASITEK